MKPALSVTPTCRCFQLSILPRITRKKNLLLECPSKLLQESKLGSPLTNVPCGGNQKSSSINQVANAPTADSIRKNVGVDSTEDLYLTEMKIVEDID